MAGKFSKLFGNPLSAWQVEELIDGLERKGSKLVDLQEEFSLPFAFKVIYEMLGIPFKVGPPEGPCRSPAGDVLATRD